MPPFTSGRSCPSVSVIVLNCNGKAHLQSCLPALEALDYPCVEVVVADNGSGDGSQAWVRAAHPRARLIEFGVNLGFAAAYNRAIDQCESDYVALLNNDTRVEPSWLTELVDAAERHGVAAAGALVLDWDGSRVDFAGAAPTAFGHAWQRDHGRPSGGAYAEHRMLFACGAAALVRREHFLRAGGFDEAFFAYFEDVDLGWRLNLLGHGTVFAPRAVARHRLHGTSGPSTQALRLRLYERNALRTLFKNYGDEALARVLPAAVALTLARHLSTATIEGGAVAFGQRPPRHLTVRPAVVATLIALEDLARQLPSVLSARQRVQAARQVTDAELFTLFPEPLTLHDLGDTYRDAAEALIRDFRVAELFGLPAPAVRLPVLPPPASPVVEVEAAGRVSVVVVTIDGGVHLPACLESLSSQAWPSDRLEVIVVDNGSPDGVAAHVERWLPRATIVRTGRNLGFSAGNNAGARAATGEHLLFLNDDTRVAPTSIAGLVEVAERRRAAAVGALMLDWAGERIDFAGGLVNFEGRGFALGHGERLAGTTLAEVPTFFACGGAMLVRRDVFESAGRWDEPTFAYYEDVEFGWRLRLLGHDVWMAPEAVVFHRHHGTSGAGSPARLRAFERNGLRMIYALLDDDHLRRALPAALLLAADRALLGTAFSRAAAGEAGAGHVPALAASVAAAARHALVQRGARRALGVIGSARRVGLGGLAGAVRETFGSLRDRAADGGTRSRYLIEVAGPASAVDLRRERLAVDTGAALLGLQDFLAMLPELSQRRAWLQSRRVRSDAEIFAGFDGRWTAAVPSAHGDAHAGLRALVLAALGVR
ncbi:MAG: glycosyltransferase family 2 protein [Vicinamibacterales bacterium]